LSRILIAATTVLSPDSCERSSEEMSEPQAHQSPEAVCQFEQSMPSNEAKPVPEQPIER
jgi:hypothetical protein